LRTVKKCMLSLPSILLCSFAVEILKPALASQFISTQDLANAIDPAAKTKTLRRGVKEVVKALRKSAINGPSSSGTSNPMAICIIAADISPMDVISHIPVLCEDHNIPYIYVRSRAELGEASATKRPTSVVMVSKERVSKKAKDVKEEDVKEFEESFVELTKLVGKASKGVKK
jgi:H/ACA ribonucleoprotein complex subunit 2